MNVTIYHFVNFVKYIFFGFNKELAVLGMENKATRVPKVDLKQYAKYVLSEGTLLEKRELLSNIKNTITLDEGAVTVK